MANFPLPRILARKGTARPRVLNRGLRQRAGVLEVAVHDGVGGAVDEGENGRCGIGGGVLWECRTSENEEIGQLPVLKIRRNDRMIWRGSHDRATLNVCGVVAGGIVRAQAGEWINLPSAHGAGHLDSFGRGELGHLAFVVPPVESQRSEEHTSE